VGARHEVVLSFTHVLPRTAQFGAQYADIQATNIDLGAKYLYTDGTSTLFTGFSEGQDKNSSSAVLEKAGTVLLSARCSMTMFGSIPIKAFSKQILNAESDGWSAHAVGEEMEIVPQSDIADARVGDTIKFKVILKSAPLPGATVEWADPASAIYEDPEEGGDANILKLSDETASDGTFSYTITHAGLNALAVAHSDEGSGVSYAVSLIFDAEDASDSGGGCNVGLGGLSLTGLPILLSFLPRKTRV
jgi:uncharacterized GH25 family protein